MQINKEDNKTISYFFQTNKSTHLIGIDHLELPAVAGPGDEGLTRLVAEQLQEELPELDGAGGRDGGPGHAPRVGQATGRRGWR